MIYWNPYWVIALNVNGLNILTKNIVRLFKETRPNHMLFTEDTILIESYKQQKSYRMERETCKQTLIGKIKATGVVWISNIVASK